MQAKDRLHPSHKCSPPTLLEAFLCEVEGYAIQVLNYFMHIRHCTSRVNSGHVEPSKLPSAVLNQKSNAGCAGP